MIHTGSAGPEAKPPDPLNPHQAALCGNGLFHPEGQLQMVVIQGVRPPGITGIMSCNMSSCADFSPIHVLFPFSIFPFLLALPPLFSSLFQLTPDLSHTTSKPGSPCCILRSENVLNASDMCEGFLKHTDILEPLQSDI